MSDIQAVGFAFALGLAVGNWWIAVGVVLGAWAINLVLLSNEYMRERRGFHNR